MLTSDNGQIVYSKSGRTFAVALIRPERAAEILAERGLTYAIAQAIAAGALATKASAVALAQQRGLVQ